MEKLLAPKDIMEITGSGRSTVYALFNREDFPVIHIGRKIYVSEDALRAWFERGGTVQNGERRYVERAV